MPDPRQIKDDEKWLLLAIAAVGPGRSVRDVLNEMLTIPWKRAIYVLEKFCRWDWYEYGVTLDLGWLTPAGREAADLLRKS